MAGKKKKNKKTSRTDRRPRESIWSVPPEYRAFYYFLFITQSLIGMSYVVWHQIWINDSDAFYETAAAIILMNVAIMVHSAGTGVIIAEMRMVLAQYLEEHYYAPRRKRLVAKAREEGREEGVVEGLKKGVEEGREEGIAEGISVGLEQAYAEIQAWNERRLEAEAKGEPFDEPPPQSKNGSKP